MDGMLWLYSMAGLLDGPRMDAACVGPHPRGGVTMGSGDGWRCGLSALRVQHRLHIQIHVGWMLRADNPPEHRCVGFI
jgi:hypothetical protein